MQERTQKHHLQTNAMIFFKAEMDSDMVVIFLHSSMYLYISSYRCISFILFIFQFMHSCFQRWVSMWWNISKHLPTVVSCSINKNSIIVISVLGYDTNAGLLGLHLLNYNVLIFSGKRGRKCSVQYIAFSFLALRNDLSSAVH